MREEEAVLAERAGEDWEVLGDPGGAGFWDFFLLAGLLGTCPMGEGERNQKKRKEKSKGKKGKGRNGIDLRT